jgi:O-antigen ligase
MISGQADLPSGSKNMQASLSDEGTANGDSPTRWLPDWMVLRIPRLNLPAPLALVVIAAALLAAIMAPTLATKGRMGLMVVGAILGIAGLVMVVKWRILGLIALPIISMIVPFAIGTGSETGISAAVLWLGLLLGLWLLDMVARQRQIRLLPYRPVIVSLIFGVVVIVAFGFGQLPWFATRSASLSAQIGGLLIFLLSIGAFLLAAHQIHNITELKWMTFTFLGIGLLFFSLRIFAITWPLADRIFVRQGVLGAGFYVWLIAMAFSQVLYNKDLAPGWRILAVILIFMVFYVNMGNESRSWVSGWLPPMVVVVTLILLGRPNLGLFAIILGGLILILNPDIIASVVNEGDNTYSTITRLEAWRIVLEIAKVNPIFGLGMANYYWYTPLFPILGYKISFNSHNNYIDIIAQTGLVGLLCFLWFFGEVWLLGWRMRNMVPDGFPKAYVLGALGGVMGTLALAGLGDWVIPFVYNIGLDGFRASMFVFLFLGGLVAIANIYHIAPSKNVELQSE